MTIGAATASACRRRRTAGSPTCTLGGDTGAEEALGGSAEATAAKLDAQITPSERTAWAPGTPRTWAMESFELGRRDAYALPSRPACADHGSVALTAAYGAEAEKDAAVQLEKAGVRMAVLLDRALAS